MSVRTITVTIPEMLFLQLEAAARSSAQSVDAVVAQSLERAIPAHLAALLPPALQAELDAMEHLSDAALRAIAESVALPERGIQMDDLIALKQAGTITPEQQEQLTALRGEFEALMVRKAHAFVLLKSRGHTPHTSAGCWSAGIHRATTNSLRYPPLFLSHTPLIAFLPWRKRYW